MRALDVPSHMPPRWGSRITVAENGCWNWSGATVRGYGYVTYRRRNMLVHRALYTILYGRIPDGLQAHHTCERRSCVNPTHLELLTQGQHSVAHDHIGIRAAAELRKARTRCKHGHEFTPENTRIKTDRSGKQRRICRTCSRAQNVLDKRRKKEREA